MRRPVPGRGTTDGKDNINACHTQTTRRPSRRQAEGRRVPCHPRERPAGHRDQRKEIGEIMSAKQLVFDAQARRQLKTGIDALANAVKVTLGPRGRNVAIDKKWGSPTITHDGVTVAKEIELADPYQNMGAQMLKQAATKTNDVAGDGTTTATVLAQAIVTEGLRNVTAGANPML